MRVANRRAAFASLKDERRHLPGPGFGCSDFRSIIGEDGRGSKQGATVGYTFEWDPNKAESNRHKHGVTFDEASTVFRDPLSLLMSDPDHSVDEERYVVLGMSRQRRLLVVAFAERPPHTRLISARPAGPQERKRYEEET